MSLGDVGRTAIGGIPGYFAPDIIKGVSGAMQPTTSIVPTGQNTPASQFAPQWGELLSMIFSGQPLQGGGASPQQRTMDIARNISGLLQQRDVSSAQSSVQQLIEKDIASGLANLQEGFTSRGAGTATGTPAAVASSRYMAEAVPRKALATEQIQQQELARVAAFLLPLLGLGQQFAGIGIPRAEESILVGESPFSQIANLLAGLAQGSGSLAAGLSAGA